MGGMEELTVIRHFIQEPGRVVGWPAGLGARGEGYERSRSLGRRYKTMSLETWNEHLGCESRKDSPLPPHPFPVRC